MKRSPMVKRTAWKTHAMFTCMDCEWSAEWYRTAPDLARKHSEKYGHQVQGETGYAVYYAPKWLEKTR